LNFVYDHKMKAIMNIENLKNIEDLEQFIQGNQVVAFTVLGDKNERYKFIQKTLVKFRYLTLKKPEKGIVNRYLRKISGYSRQQLTRLIVNLRQDSST
ncbi:hypothetical protein, partial [Aliivibrio sp.]|uniref:hypothetical protein n=1 Tax=Aliivibrio sp. TaxID=1872443 RepID=UPI003D2F1704